MGKMEKNGKRMGKEWENGKRMGKMGKEWEKDGKKWEKNGKKWEKWERDGKNGKKDGEKSVLYPSTEFRRKTMSDNLVGSVGHGASCGILWQVGKALYFQTGISMGSARSLVGAMQSRQRHVEERMHLSGCLHPK